MRLQRYRHSVEIESLYPFYGRYVSNDDYVQPLRKSTSRLRVVAVRS
jgi:hypothetical protein